MGDVGVPANQRKALFVITQIKHGLLGGKRLSDDNATNPTCAKKQTSLESKEGFLLDGSLHMDIFNLAARSGNK